MRALWNNSDDHLRGGGGVLIGPLRVTRVNMYVCVIVLFCVLKCVTSVWVTGEPKSKSAKRGIVVQSVQYE